VSAEPPAAGASRPLVVDDPVALEALLTALQRGDEDALHRLLPSLRGRLTAIAKHRLEGGEAEEVVQDTLVILWEKRASVRDGTHLIQFAFQTLRHLIGNVHAMRRRHSAATSPELPGSAHGSWGQPEHGAREEEMDRLLDEAIARCASENESWGRILGWLRDGHTPAEVGEKLGDVPVATVYTRIHRARERLREILRTLHRVED